MRFEIRSALGAAAAVVLPVLLVLAPVVGCDAANEGAGEPSNVGSTDRSEHDAPSANAADGSFGVDETVHIWCSKGPPRDPRFPPPPATFPIPERRPECPPRCGAKRLPVGRYSLADIPSGACEEEGVVCGMIGQMLCAGGAYAAGRSVVCKCDRGEWNCGSGGIPLAGGCEGAPDAATPEDAGPDASP